MQFKTRHCKRKLKFLIFTDLENTTDFSKCNNKEFATAFIVYCVEIAKRNGSKQKLYQRFYNFYILKSQVKNEICW